MTTAEKMAVYAALGVAEFLTMVVGMLAAAYGGLVASRRLHRPFVHRLLRAPMSFYDATPVGRILNRAGKDMELIDNRISANVRWLLYSVFTVGRSVLLMLYATPLAAIVLVSLGVIYTRLLRRYFKTSKQLKHLEAVTRSVIYSHFGETVEGAATIRAFQETERFQATAEQRIDVHASCQIINMKVERWMQVRAELASGVLVLCCTLYATVYRQSDALNAADIFVSVNGALSIVVWLNVALRQMAELEANIVAVERISEYANIRIEPQWRSLQDAAWPRQGRIRFENFSTRYYADGEPVLHCLNIDISAGEKVGIVGRTGAGKSSIALALFRIIEASEGRILIDDVDISTIGLSDLRSKLAIIPQDPVLLCATLRVNLDPFNQHSDSELCTALQLANLKEFVEGRAGGLEQVITEGGSNLSVGQRQLVCLARAMLRGNRILVLDEPTAAIDAETDAVIQSTIKRHFAHCTIITIAHRVNTVLDYDRIIVLDKGEIKEIGRPQALLADSNSAFYAISREM